MNIIIGKRKVKNNNIINIENSERRRSRKKKIDNDNYFD
jgi:hypothetical protein